jgi:ATP-dependent exoDNAse (exonuclease V) beta subunit
MRLFYVATTRAKYRLAIVGQTKEIKDVLEDNGISELNHYIDYLKIGDMHCEEAFAPLAREDSQNKTVICCESDTELTEKISKALAFSYPYDKMDIPIKASVSSVSFEKEKIYDISKSFGETSAEKGTAYHKFLELWSFDENWREFYVGEAKQKMLERDYELLSEQVLEKICSMRVYSSLNNFTIYKEKEFIVGVPYSLIAQSNIDEEIVIQGTIDLLAVSKEKAVVLDYKYSSIKDEGLAEKYRKQLALYAYAVQKLLNLPVEAHLINIYSQKIVSYSEDSLKLQK